MGPAADLITIIGAPLAILGIALAWRQLTRTADAAAAAEDAARATSRDLATYQVLTLINEAHHLENSIDLAVKAANGSRLIELFNEWKRVGTELRGLLEGNSRVDDELLRLLAQTFALATQAKGHMMQASPDVITTTVRIRRAIGEVTGRLGTLSGQLKANIGGS